MVDDAFEDNDIVVVAGLRLYALSSSLIFHEKLIIPKLEAVTVYMSVCVLLRHRVLIVSLLLEREA